MDPIQAIDVHVHYGEYSITEREPVRSFCSGDLDVVRQRARAAGIAVSIVSPLAALYSTETDGPIAANEHASASTSEEILHWVVVDPMRPRTFDQAGEMLGRANCAGIKIHPEQHHYTIGQHGEEIFAFAAEHRAVVLTHSGEPNSLPSDFVCWADRYPEVSIILAHLGFGPDNDVTQEVQAIQAARHGNLYTDTSSAKSILPGLIEWAVAEVGVEHILFGTDSPLYFEAAQRARIDHADLTDDQKRLILRDNVRHLLAHVFAKEECNQCAD